MRWLDKLGGDSVGPTPVCDARMVALARTNVQQGTMWAVRAIFPAIRINLPEGGGRRRLGTMSKDLRPSGVIFGRCRSRPESPSRHHEPPRWLWLAPALRPRLWRG